MKRIRIQMAEPRFSQAGRGSLTSTQSRVPPFIHGDNGVNDIIDAENEEAEKSRAPRNIEESLTECLRLFCKSQGIPYLSADELLFEELTQEQREWVSAFVNLWDANSRYT
jgi:hypothetical protein